MATTLVKMAEDSRYSSWIHPYAVAARDKGRAEESPRNTDSIRRMDPMRI